MAERLRGDEALVVVARVASSTRPAASLACSSSTQLRLHEGLAAQGCARQREAVPTGRPPLARLGRSRAPLRGFRAAARRRRGGTEATVERSRRRGRARVGSAPTTAVRARSCESTHFQSLGESDEWLVEDAPVGRGVLECRSPVGRRLERRPWPSNASAESRRYEHVRGQRLVADLHGEREGDARSAEAPRRNARTSRRRTRRGPRARPRASRDRRQPRRRPGRRARPLRPVPRRGGSAREPRSHERAADPVAAARSPHAAVLRLVVSPPLRSADRPPRQPDAAPGRGDRTASTRLPGRA